MGARIGHLVLSEIERRLDLVVITQSKIALHEIGVGHLDGSILLQGGLEELDRPPVLPETIGDHPPRHERLDLTGHQAAGVLVAGKGFRLPARGLEGQAEVEVPLWLIRVEVDRLPQLGLRLGPSAALEPLQSPISV